MQKTKLEIVRAKAKSKNIKGVINISSKPNKKFMLTTIEGRIIHFGQIGFSDFLDHNDLDRRRAFHARFKNNINYNKKYTAMYLARLLW